MSDPLVYSDPHAIRKALRIRDPGELPPALNALKTQLYEATKIRVDPMEKKTRPLVEYVQSCTDSSDLTDLWDFQVQKNMLNLECTVPEIIALFLDLCTTPIIRPFGLQLTQTILDAHMKYLTRGVASTRIPQVIATFKLLVSMCSLGAPAANAIFHSFNFQTEGFLRAARYRQKTKSTKPKRYLYDLRTFYVRFVLSFFIHAESNIKKEILNIKNCVTGVFNTIDEDAYGLLEEIFSTTKQYLMDDPHVPRYNKNSFFSSYILEKIAKLYARSEPEIIGDGETGIPAELAHKFLLDICTIPGKGICYRSSGWYPLANPVADCESTTSATSKAQNKTLGSFIATLKPSNDILQQKLVLKVIEACPELAQGYFRAISAGVEPRLNSKWLSTIALIQKIIRLPVPSLSYGDTNIYPSTPPPVSVILDNILPTAFGRAISTRGIRNHSALVSYSTILLITASFLKYTDVASAIDTVISSSDLQGAHKWRECLVEVRDGFRRRLPDITTIATIYQQAYAGKISNDTDENELRAQHQLIQDSALRLLRFYQQCLPEASMEASVEPSNFIPTDILSMRPESLVHLLGYLLNVPDFKWSNKTAKTSLSHIMTLFILYLQSPHKHIRNLTAKLINQTLSDSIMFRHDPEEIRLWLEGLPRSHQTQLTDEQTLVLQFFDECINRFNGSQYRYIDQLVDLVGRVENSCKDKLQHLHMILNSERDDEDIIYPFSPLLLTVLQHMKTFKGDKNIITTFVANVMTQLIAKQKVPYYLEALYNQMAMHDEEDRFEDPRCIREWPIQYITEQLETCLLDSMTPVDGLDSQMALDEGNLEAILSDEPEKEMSVRQEKIVEILPMLPVAVIDRHLRPIAEILRGKLQFMPLVQYISQRHPLAGSLFTYRHIASLNGYAENDDVLVELLKALPFNVLFYNSWKQCDENQLARDALKHTLSRLDLQELKFALSLILEKLSMLVISGHIMTPPLSLACDLMSHIVSQTPSSDKEQLMSLLHHHPAMNELMNNLIQQLENLRAKQNENTDPQFVRIMVRHLNLFSHTHNIVDYLVTIDDYDALDKELQDDLSKLLISLVGEICESGDIEVQEAAFKRVSKLWKTGLSEELGLDMLSLLNSCAKRQLPGLSILLDSCTELVIQCILAGGECAIDLHAIQNSSRKINLDVVSMVRNSLEKGMGEFRQLSAAFVGIIQVGYELDDGDNRHDYVQHVVEKLLKILANPKSVQVADSFYDRFAVFMDMTDFDWTVIDREVVRDYILNTILDSLSNAAAIRFTSTLASEAYKNHDKREPIETYLRRVLDHAEFQNLTNPEQDTAERRAIIRLVHTFNVIQPDILSSLHGLIDSLLTAYGATTSSADRMILDVLRSCEAHGQSSIIPKMLLWGPGSDRRRQAHAQAGTLLQADTISVETFGLIDPDLMEYSWMHYPANVTLDLFEVHDNARKPIYDPAFFLPLLSNLISSGAADCKRFLESNSHGMMLLSLSSENEQVRMLGYQMMDQFYILFQHSRITEYKQLMMLFDELKNSIVDRADGTTPPRIPAAVTVCVAHAVAILMDPGHYMHSHIAKWLLRSPNIDLNVVPMFTWLFISATPTHRKERLWLLQVLASSIRTVEDYRIFSRRQVWDMIMAFYLSPVADSTSKEAVIEIMSHAISIPNVAKSLVRHHGLDTWIHQVLALAENDEESKTWSALLEQATQ
ncbi:ribosome 60S biogenesis N-terminal-domain-containing protein [Dichotomocladium elegans]|nr:ribosome 60S biogenesis N-terminal-domain-containing protein [Dichotomocladium elegans]